MGKPYLVAELTWIEFEWAISERVVEASIGKYFGDGPSEFIMEILM